MPQSRFAWVLRKGVILLPIVLILALARCSGDTSGNSEGEGPDQAAEPASQSPVPAQQQAADEEPPAERRNVEDFTASEIKAALVEHIEQRTEMGTPGVFEITDPRTSQNLQLQFLKIHDPVNTLGGGHYFACTDFADINDPYKTYDLDFWLQVHDGELVVYEENTHKLPVREGGRWQQEPRYNFVDDRINLLR